MQVLFGFLPGRYPQYTMVSPPNGASMSYSSVYYKRTYCRNIVMLTDSRVAIMILYSVATSLKIMGQCRDAMLRLGGKLKITLWVFDHRNQGENERVDGLPKQRSALGSLSVGAVGTMKSRIYSQHLTAADFRRRRLTICPKSSLRFARGKYLFVVNLPFS